MAKNFGLKINADAFYQIARSIPYTVIRKERANLLHIEALLFGQAGLLDGNYQDVYFHELRKTYRYLSHKYQLEKPLVQIRFFRLRPPNFPTVRLAQLSRIIYDSDRLFSLAMQADSPAFFYDNYRKTTSEYWHSHYVFDKESKSGIKRPSKKFVDLLLINTLIPIKFTYQKYRDEPDVDALFQLAQNIKPEKNAIIEKFAQLGFESHSALETQALLQLKHRYCDIQACLQCVIGNRIIKN